MEVGPIIYGKSYFVKQILEQDHIELKIAERRYIYPKRLLC